MRHRTHCDVTVGVNVQLSALQIHQTPNREKADLGTPWRENIAIKHLLIPVNSFSVVVKPISPYALLN